MTAANKDFICDQGAEFVRILTAKDDEGDVIDLTGYTARMQVRGAVGAAVLASLTTSNGGIAINGVAGQLTLKLTHSQTDAIDVSGLPTDRVTDGNVRKSGPCAVYDLEVIDPVGNVSRWIEGKFLISQQVTA